MTVIHPSLPWMIGSLTIWVSTIQAALMKANHAETVQRLHFDWPRMIENPHLQHCDFQMDEHSALINQPRMEYQSDSGFEDWLYFLNKLDITFALMDGSMLGALRNHGKIPGDNDMDFMVPIWLNEPIIRFGIIKDGNNETQIKEFEECMESQKSKGFIPNTSKKEDSSDEDSDDEGEEEGKDDRYFCGKNMNEWRSETEKWIDFRVSEMGDDVKNEIWIKEIGLLKNHINGRWVSDLWIKVDEDRSLSKYDNCPNDNNADNSGVRVFHNDHQYCDAATKHPYCRCSFNDIITFCYRDTIERVIKQYGSDWETPDREPGQNK